MTNYKFTSKKKTINSINNVTNQILDKSYLEKKTARKNLLKEVYKRRKIILKQWVNR